jgi:hypothetical protein
LLLEQRLMSLNAEAHLRILLDQNAAEHFLISQRIGWLLAMEGILFSTFAITLANGAVKDYWWITFLIMPLLGAVTAFLGRSSIRAAVVTINHWNDKLEAFFAEHPDLRAFSNHGRGHHVHLISLRFPRLIPDTLVAMWALLGVVGISQAWHHVLPSLP